MINEYPRPQMVRENWTSLNGIWEFAFDDEERGETEGWYLHFPESGREILVPYTYETRLSGIGEETFHPVVWYQKKICTAKSENRILLHFEGSDYLTKVWINGKFAGGHRGGYARFSMDVTELLREGENTVTVRVQDSLSCIQPRGKQRWKKENFGCWYVQTTGIWKTVWMEEVPVCHVERVKITPDLDRAKVKFEIRLNQAPQENARFQCQILLDGRKVTSAKIDVPTQVAELELSVANPDEPWQVAVWTPQNPRLYDVVFRLETGAEEKTKTEADEVRSYFGMRKISVEHGKVLLNNLPFYQRLILDQGYWEESHLTAPSDEAFCKDIDLVLAAGYNGVRKHEKVEDERFLYWCDKKGLVVWLEMPSQYTFHDASISEYTGQWLEIVEQNYNHPCIITWTTFNESWGVERIYSDERQKHFTEGIYYLTKAYDTMRPVITNDGWEHTISDILTLHDYEESGERFQERYRDQERIVGNEIPFNLHRYAMAKERAYRGQPVLISEYGGIAFSAEEGWGYGKQVGTQEEFLERFADVTHAIQKMEYSVGFCYTQLTDVQQEINGLYTIKREPKVDIEAVRRINMSE